MCQWNILKSNTIVIKRFGDQVMEIRKVLLINLTVIVVVLFQGFSVGVAYGHQWESNWSRRWFERSSFDHHHYQSNPWSSLNPYPLQSNNYFQRYPFHDDENYSFKSHRTYGGISSGLNSNPLTNIDRHASSHGSKNDHHQQFSQNIR